MFNYKSFDEKETDPSVTVKIQIDDDFHLVINKKWLQTYLSNLKKIELVPGPDVIERPCIYTDEDS